MKSFFRLFISFVLITSYQLSNNFYAQNNSIILDGAYIVLDGGTAANNIFVVVDQTDPAGIIRLPAGGHIHSENQYNHIKWLSGTTAGSYVFPFGVGANAADYIPLTFDKTAGNSSVSASTWGTDAQNMPHPAATNVGPVINMTGTTDSVEHAIDRFWDIQATTTTADLTFSYKGSENTTLYPANSVQAQHWNGNSWDTPVGPGAAGVTTGIGTAGPFVGQNTFSPWVLVIPCAPDSTGIDVQIACDSYTWIDGITYTADNNTATHNIAGGTINGCDSIVTLVLTVINSPNVSLTSNGPICEGEALNLDATTINGATYQWSGPNGYTSQNQNPTINTTDILNTGIYELITSDGNGCADTTEINVTINPLPIVNGSITDDNCATGVGEVSTQVSSPNAPFTYSWSNGSTNSNLTGVLHGTYQVTVTDNASCSVSKSFSIFNNIDECNCFVYVANAFSPNGDGNNDFITVRGECVTQLSFRIYNKWGNLVFETDKINDGWDGYFRGNLQNTGIYVYVLEATLDNGETIKESGDITLIR